MSASRPSFPDLPPELLKHVLDELTSDFKFESQEATTLPTGQKQQHVASDGSHFRRARQHLGNYSLTCRYWANECRPLMFNRLTLRSRDDLITLMSFVDCPVSRIGGYIKAVEVEDEPNGTCNGELSNLLAMSLFPKIWSRKS
ncbi:hypothetical protein VKT23_018934 [Stygiomarasmius scandens]|uniref:F-box domain-containing protein n=1 Tax=Marasmiellus scandens TaxID=2682957 RepID=A0ABR1INK8_9AGAR